MGVGIRFDTGQTFVKSKGNTKQIITNIPEVEEELADGIANDLKSAIQRSIARKGLTWSDELKNNVDVDATKSSGGGTSFEVSANAYSNEGVNYAAWHEYATKGHYVDVNRQNSPIHRWANSKGMDAHTIFVTPANRSSTGSFMEPAVQKTIRRTRKIVRSGKNPLWKNLARAYK